MNGMIEEAVKKGVEDVNLQQEDGNHISCEDNQVLIGEDSVLDSLGILLFATAVESYLKPSMPNVNLVDLLMSADNSIHFESIGTLKRYLHSVA